MMTSPQNHEIEQRLERLGRDWPTEASIVARVMDEIERAGVRPTPAAARAR